MAAGKIISENPGGISSDAVKKATGRGWAQWIKLLDKEKAFELPHKTIAKMVCEKFEQSGWWSQMITVGYEQAKGLRVKHQRGKDFNVSASKTIHISVKLAFAAWEDEKIRAQWLKEKWLQVRTLKSPKYIRFTWKDGVQIIAANFYAKGTGKCTVTVDHTKLKSEKEIAPAKKYWKEKLEKLSEFLSKP